jgi:hypothetical protein
LILDKNQRNILSKLREVGDIPQFNEIGISSAKVEHFKDNELKNVIEKEYI